VGKAVGAGITALAEALAAGLQAGADAAAAFGKFLNALSILNKLQAVAELYGVSTSDLTSLEGGGPIHKPAPDGTSLVHFRVVAGVADSEWADYLRQRSAVDAPIKSCLDLLGLPSVTDAGGVGEAVTGWKASWYLEQGGHDQLGQISLAYNTFEFHDPLANHLTRRNDHSGQTDLVIDLLPEQANEHPGTLVTRPLVVKAAVETAPPPDPATWLTAGDAGAFADPFGLASALVDVGASLFQDLATFDAYETVLVENHVRTAGVWRGSIDYTDGYRFSVPTLPNPNRPGGGARVHTAAIVSEYTATATLSTGFSTINGWTVAARNNVHAHDDVVSTEEYHWYDWPCTHSLRTVYESHAVRGDTFPADEFHIQVKADGTWSVDLFTRRMTLNGTYISVYDLTSVGDPKQCQSVHSTGAGSNTTIFVETGLTLFGRFDPAHPPSALSGTLTGPSTLGVSEGQSKLNVRLDYGGPIPVPGR